MSQASQYVAADGAPLGVAPTGASCHQRAAVTATAGPLGGFITAIGNAVSGIPYMLKDPNVPNLKTFPKAVNLQIEAGQAAVSIYMTTDGHDTALGDVSATLGLDIIPVAPSWTRVPVDCSPTAGANSTGLVRLKASAAGPTYVQCLFEF